jgi:hypothetical protein
LSRRFATEFSVPEDGSWPSRLSLIAGLSYALVGLLQILVSIGLVAPIMGFTDVVGGFLLIIVAAVFLTGVKPLSKNEQEGYAFIAVGYILAAVLFGLQILVILTNGIGWLLGFQNWLNWDISNDISPSLWMFMILMTGTGSLWAIGNLREKLQPRSKEDSPS